MTTNLRVSLCAVALCLVASSSFAQEGTAPPAEEGGPRPSSTAVGIGVGYVFPTSILEPNTASARFRLGAVALEPRVVLGGNSSNIDGTSSRQVGDQAPVEDTVETRGQGWALALGTDVRLPLAARGPVELVFIGGIGLGYSTATAKQERPDDNMAGETTTTRLSAGVNWGLGVELFLGRGFSLSADAMNPLVSWSREREVAETRFTPVGGPAVVTSGDTTTSGISYGLTFAPTIRAMVHLYF